MTELDQQGLHLELYSHPLVCRQKGPLIRTGQGQGSVVCQVLAPKADGTDPRPWEKGRGIRLTHLPASSPHWLVHQSQFHFFHHKSCPQEMGFLWKREEMQLISTEGR